MKKAAKTNTVGVPNVDMHSTMAGRCNCAHQIKPGDVLQCAAELARHVMEAARGMTDEAFWLVPMSGDMELCYPLPRLVCSGVRYPYVIYKRFNFPVQMESLELKGVGCFAVVGFGTSLVSVAERLRKTACLMAMDNGDSRRGYFFCYDVLAVDPGGNYVSFRESGLYDFDLEPRL